jgi:transcriptional repressor NrdR
VNCPQCNHDDTRVTDSRELDEGAVIRRRRLCSSCQARFTTYERVESTNLLVVKKDGRREQFDRGKLGGGIYTALEKRPYPREAVEALINRIEAEARRAGETEIGSMELGEIVMENLRDFDDVAYIRFASVYRSFADVASFERELRKVLKKGKSKAPRAKTP